MKQLFQFCRLGAGILLPFVAFTISLRLPAQSNFQKPVSQSRVIEFGREFNEVEVVGDATIILTNNLEGKVLFQGDPEKVQHAEAIVKKRKLIIRANRTRKSGNLTIYVPASNIGLLTASGKTEILSSGTIKIRELEIYLNGSSFVSVRYDGKLQVVPGTGYEVIDTMK